jgi:hypothetical protein
MLQAYMTLKEEELTAFRMQTHPLEFQLYYIQILDATANQCPGCGTLATCETRS